MSTGTAAAMTSSRFRQTVIFEDLSGHTRITWRGDFPTAAERNRVIKDYGADKGLVETLARLDDYVAAMASDQKRKGVA